LRDFFHSLAESSALGKVVLAGKGDILACLRGGSQFIGVFEQSVTKIMRPTFAGIGRFRANKLWQIMTIIEYLPTIQVHDHKKGRKPRLAQKMLISNRV